MGARETVERMDGFSKSIAPYLRYKGETGVRSGLALSKGKSYRVMLLDGFGSLQIRVYDFDFSFSCINMSYRNLAEFLQDWEGENG